MKKRALAEADREKKEQEELECLRQEKEEAEKKR